MKISPYGLQAPVFQCLQSGNARILEEDDEGMLLEDRLAGIRILDVQDPRKGIQWLRKHRRHGSLVMVLREKVFQQIRQRLPLQSRGPCLQGIWMKQRPEQHRIELVPAELEDVEYLSQDYDLASQQELMAALRDRRLFAGLDGTRRVGVCGIHPEGAMGMLYIRPEYRGRGYGEALEQALISEIMDRGLVPYAQVFEDNVASISLQRKIGMSYCDDLVCWFRDED